MKKYGPTSTSIIQAFTWNV